MVNKLKIWLLLASSLLMSLEQVQQQHRLWLTTAATLSLISRTLEVGFVSAVEASS